MEIEVILDGKKRKAGYKGLSAYLYRQQFKADLLLDAHKKQSELIAAMVKDIAKREAETNKTVENKEMEESEVMEMMIQVIGTELLERFAYIGIRTSENIGNFVNFLSTVDNYNQLIEVGIQVFEMIIYGDEPIVQAENYESENDKKKKV